MYCPWRLFFGEPRRVNFVFATRGAAGRGISSRPDHNQGAVAVSLDLTRLMYFFIWARRQGPGIGRTALRRTHKLYIFLLAPGFWAPGDATGNRVGGSDYPKAKGCSHWTLIKLCAFRYAET